MNIALGPRMGPSLAEVPMAVESKGRPLDKPSSFDNILQQQDPKVDSPGRTTPMEERRLDSADDKAPSEEIRPETDVIKRIGKKENASFKEIREEQAMLEFMDSMESEFGIPPAKIVEAMAHLKPSDLLKSPDQTASQVIHNLDLSPEDESRALMLYTHFLQQWQRTQRDPANFFATNPPVMLGRPELRSAQGLGPLEQKKLMSESLDRMNDKFFLKDAVSRSQLAQSRIEPRAMGMVNRDLLSDAMFPSDPPQDTVKIANVLEDGRLAKAQVAGKGEGIPPQLLAQMQAATPSERMALAAKWADQQAMSSPDSQLAQTLGPDSLANLQTTPAHAFKASDFFAAAQQPAVKQVAMADVTSPQNSLTVRDLMTPNIATHLATGKDSGLNSGWGSQDSSDLSSHGDSMGGDKLLSLNGDQLFPKPTALGASGMAVPTAAVMKANVADPNLQAIMNQAQLMVSRGGGEATMKLNPEGLGEVRLKVMVVNGRVNVEMAAQTNEAKQLIESSISDLRSSLSSHKLAVDHIKVDVGNQAQSDFTGGNNAHRGMDMKPDLNRDQAQRFLNQFREENASRRDPFYETPAIKQYQRNLNPAPMAPATDRVSSRFVGKGRGERMNLVG